MLRLYADRYTACMRILAGMRAWFSRKEHTPEKDLLLFRGMLVTVKSDFQKLPLSPSLQQQLDRLITKTDMAKGTAEHTQILGTLIEELIDNLKAEMGAVLCLIVDSKRRAYYEQAQPLFGDTVIERFPKAERDIKAAGSCIALEQWTAAVFHLMRAAEVALQRLAKRLGFQFAEFRDWGFLLKHLDGRLKEWENEQATPTRDKRLGYYSAARADLAAFNFAWRRHVAHGHETYDENEAMLVFTHVKSLMQRLATGFPR